METDNSRLIPDSSDTWILPDLEISSITNNTKINNDEEPEVLPQLPISTNILISFTNEDKKRTQPSILGGRAKIHHVATEITEQKPRPPLSYNCLAALALINSENGHLNVQEIYNFIGHNFPYFQFRSNAKWKNSVRHTLALTTSFGKRSTIKRGGCRWYVKPTEQLKLFIEIQKSYSKNPIGVKSAMLNPECWELMQNGALQQSYNNGLDSDNGNGHCTDTDATSSAPISQTVNYNNDLGSGDGNGHLSDATSSAPIPDNISSNHIDGSSNTDTLGDNDNSSPGVGIVHDEDANIDIKEECRADEDCQVYEDGDGYSSTGYTSGLNSKERDYSQDSKEFLTFYAAASLSSHGENLNQHTGISKRDPAKIQNEEFVTRRLESFSESISCSGAVENGEESCSDDNSEFILGDPLFEPVLQLPVSSKDPKKRSIKVKQGRLRRKLLRTYFIDLKKEIPSIAKCKTAAKVNILNTATVYISGLEKEGESLAVKKASLEDDNDILKQKLYKLDREYL